MLTVCSPTVVDKAIAANDLCALASFEEIAQEGGADAVSKAIILRLKASRAGDRTRPDANIMDLSYDGPSPEDCQVDPRRGDLQLQRLSRRGTYQDFSEKTLKLIGEAKDDLFKQLTEKQQRWAAFKLKIPILDPDGGRAHHDPPGPADRRYRKGTLQGQDRTVAVEGPGRRHRGRDQEGRGQGGPPLPGAGTSNSTSGSPPGKPTSTRSCAASWRSWRPRRPTGRTTRWSRRRSRRSTSCGRSWAVRAPI